MPFFPEDPHVTPQELARDARAHFSKRSSEPLYWLGYALALRDSARLLWGYVDAASDDEDRFGRTSVALMLSGLAIEVLAKALLVQQNPAVVPEFRGSKGHDIVALVAKTRVPITKRARGATTVVGFRDVRGPLSDPNGA